MTVQILTVNILTVQISTGDHHKVSIVGGMHNLWSPYVIGRPYIFSCCGLFMVALCNRADHIYFHPVSSSFFFFFLA